MDEKFWNKGTWLTILAAAVTVVIATGAGLLIMAH